MKKIALLLAFAGIVWAGYSQKSVESQPVPAETALQAPFDGTEARVSLPDNLIWVEFEDVAFQYTIARFYSEEPLMSTLTVTGGGDDYLFDDINHTYYLPYGHRFQITMVSPASDGSYNYVF